MPEYFVGIDVSTTASKALVIDSAGTVIASKSYPHDISTPHPLWSEQDPEQWWQATASALRDVMQSISAQDVLAVGLTGQMHGLTVLDSHGKPLRPAILWNDGRSAAQCEAVTTKIGEKRVYEITGSRIQPGFTAPKILWLKENEPEIYAQIRHVLLPKDYIRYRLSKAFCTDVSDASGYALLDVGKRNWSDEMLSAFSVPREWLSDVCESTDVCAYVDDEGAAATGLRAGTPIVAGAGDQPAGGIGNGIVHRGETSLTIGTSGVVFTASNRYNPEPNGRLHTFCHATSGMWFHMGVMLSAAGGLRWLRDIAAPNTPFEELSRQAATVSAGSGGLLFAPYLTGERNPHPDPLARGAFVGLTVRHGLPHMVRAVMEGIAFGMRDNLTLLHAQDVHPKSAAISGGAAQSPVWRQIIADIMGIPLYTVNTTEGGAFGAAILAAVGVGTFPDVQHACEQLVHKVDEIHPNPEAVETYNRLYPMFHTIYPALKETFGKLSQFEA